MKSLIFFMSVLFSIKLAYPATSCPSGFHTFHKAILDAHYQQVKNCLKEDIALMNSADEYHEKPILKTLRLLDFKRKQLVLKKPSSYKMTLKMKNTIYNLEKILNLLLIQKNLKLSLRDQDKYKKHLSLYRGVITQSPNLLIHQRHVNMLDLQNLVSKESIITKNTDIKTTLQNN